MTTPAAEALLDYLQHDAKGRGDAVIHDVRERFLPALLADAQAVKDMSAEVARLTADMDEMADDITDLTAERDALRAALEAIEAAASVLMDAPNGAWKYSVDAIRDKARRALATPAAPVATPMDDDCPDSCSRWPGCGHTVRDFQPATPAAPVAASVERCDGCGEDEDHVSHRTEYRGVTFHPFQPAEPAPSAEGERG